MRDLQVLPLERRLGFYSPNGKGISRWGKISPKPVQDLAAGIDGIVEAHKELPNESIKSSKLIEDEARQLFERYGAVLWPGLDKPTPSWMAEPADATEYPRRLFFDNWDDWTLLNSLLHQLVVAKCLQKSGNHKSKMNKPLAGEQDCASEVEVSRHDRESVTLGPDIEETSTLLVEAFDNDNSADSDYRPAKKRKRQRARKETDLVHVHALVGSAGEVSTKETPPRASGSKPVKKRSRIATEGINRPSAAEAPLPTPRKSPAPTGVGFVYREPLNPTPGRSRHDSVAATPRTQTPKTNQQDDPVYLNQSEGSAEASHIPQVRSNKGKGKAKADNLVVMINWNQGMAFHDYTRVEDCTSADDFFRLLQDSQPDEVCQIGLTMKEIRITASDGGAWPRIVHGAPGADDAVYVLVRRVQELIKRPIGPESKLELSVLWKDTIPN